MKKAFLSCVFLVSALLMTACGASNSVPQTSEPVATAEITENTIPETKTEPASEKIVPGSFELSAENQKLQEFSSVEVDVMAADIKLVTGDDWAVSYNISEKEPLKRFGVEGDTLYIETTFNAKKYFDRNEDWYVTITVPEDAVLNEVELETISGNISMEYIFCDDASLSTTSGNVDVSDVSARELGLETVAGVISASGITADSLEAETVSGNIVVAGQFGELETDTVSGNTEIAGTISISGSAESTSGSIDIALDNEAAIAANSVGRIEINGEKVSNPYKTGSGIPVILKTVSGSISIKTA